MSEIHEKTISCPRALLGEQCISFKNAKNSQKELILKNENQLIQGNFCLISGFTKFIHFLNDMFYKKISMFIFDTVQKEHYMLFLEFFAVFVQFLKPWWVLHYPHVGENNSARLAYYGGEI